MNQLAKYSTLTMLALALTACGQSTSTSSRSSSGPDLGVVLDRTVMALTYAEAEMEKPESEEESEVQLEKFTTIMTGVMNAEPRPYTQPIGVNLREDAAFIGFADKNSNGVSDPGEKDEGTYRRSGAGFLTGYFVGRLLSRQSRAGVSKSSFASRNVKSSSDYRKSRPATKTARSSTRSGSSRSGQ